MTPQDSKATRRLPADIEWEMLDKSKFFVFGATFFSAVSGALYPMLLLKTRQQISKSPISGLTLALQILRHEGVHGFYRGFGTSMLGTVPARALYMSTLEITKSKVGLVAAHMGLSEPTGAAISNAMAGITASAAAQLVWTPVDVVSQRLMVQSKLDGATNYRNGFDAMRAILRVGGWKGLYRGFGMSLLTYAPSSALWWASYGIMQRAMWGCFHVCYERSMCESVEPPCSGVIMGVQGASAACAGAATAFVTTPMDTIKTRLQVMGAEQRKQPTLGEIMKGLIKEGGWKAYYKGLGARWASMSMSATTMITTYEFLKRLSAKQEHAAHTSY